MRFPRMGKQFILNRIKGDNVMITIRVGYQQYIMDNAKAVKLAELLEGTEIYEAKYHSAVDGNDSFHTYHVYPSEDNFTLELVPTTKYQVAKLAGKPAKD